MRRGAKAASPDPDYLRTVNSFAEWYRGQPEVTHVRAFPDIMKRLNKNMHGDDPAFYRIPADSELAAQYLLLYELSLPFGKDINERIDIAKSATRMTVVLRSLTSKQQRELDERALVWLLISIVASGTSAGIEIADYEFSGRIGIDGRWYPESALYPASVPTQAALSWSRSSTLRTSRAEASPWRLFFVTTPRTRAVPT